MFLGRQGLVLFLSRLAAYDALCLCLVAVGMALSVKAGLAEQAWWALGIGPLLVLAFFMKYAGLLFIPSILATLALCTLLRLGWRSMLVRGTLGVLSLAVVGTLAAMVVIHFDPSMLQGIAFTTTNRHTFEVDSRLGLVENVGEMVGLSFAVGLAGLVFARKKHLLIALLLLGSALLVPAYHIYKAELVSLDKHLGYSMFFVIPLAGYSLASPSRFRRASP